ncbi:MAG: hypothetical protein ACLFNU_03190 [Bacteroidales bacterium]
MALHDALNIRRDEIVPVSLLLFQSVFLGFFLGAFDVGANTLFLNSFEQSMIAKAFVISGFVGIILTSIYSYFQSKVKFSTLAAMNLAIVFVIIVLLRAGYYFSDTKWLAFSLFVLMGPLNIVALVGFWGTVGRIFDLRQGKRIFGFIDTGQVVGVIISSLSIPFLITIGFVTKDLLYISGVSIFLAVILQLIISSKYPLKLKVKVIKETKSSFFETLRIPYVRTMAFFVIFSMLVAFFVHYLFLSVASERFDSADEMAKFFGGLMGTLTIVSVLIKTFVYGPLMKTYGLKVSLLISPAVMIIITTCAALVGSFFGYTLESATFTFFFLLIALCRFFQKALKDSIEAPVLKLLYQSLNPSIRHEVQARVDGTINEMAALLSGIILTVLGLIASFTLIHYTYVLLGTILVWVIISVSLFKGYRKTLKDTLENASRSEKESAPPIRWLDNIPSKELSNKYKLIELSKPWLLSKELQSDLKLCETSDLIVVCNKIKEIGLVSLLPDIEKRNAAENESPNISTLEQTIDYLKGLHNGTDNINQITELIQSREYTDRVLAAKYLGASKNSEIKKNLTFLLRDMVPAVKRQAIWAAQGSRSKEIISFLIDFLDKDFYAPTAHAALINSGEIGLEMLMLAFNRTDASAIFQKRILRVVPETGSAIASNVLFEKLSVHSHLKGTILDGLLQLNLSADENDRVQLQQMIIDQTRVCAWNLNLLYHCPPESIAPNLKDELEHNYTISLHNLFQLLKLLYDRSSIDAVVENLDAGTGESISFAIELLDTFMAEDLKPYILPLLEDSSLVNKIWALQNYFPLRSYSTEELLKAIINRNENLITKYSKIYALNAFNTIENLTITADLSAQLFNADRVLRLISAQIIANNNKNSYLQLKRRLKDKNRVELDRMQNVIRLVENGTLDQLAFFKKTFENGNFLTPLFWLYNSSPMKISSINLFGLGLFRNESHVILIENGELRLHKNNNPLKVYKRGDIVRTNELNKEAFSIISGLNTIIHYIDYKKISANVYDNDFLSEFLAGKTVIV